MRLKEDPLTSKSYYKVLRHLNSLENKRDYVASISASIELTPVATLRVLQRMVDNKILPPPKKESLLNKTVYYFDIKVFTYYCNKRIGFFPESLKTVTLESLNISSKMADCNNFLEFLKRIYLIAITVIVKNGFLDAYEKEIVPFLTFLEKYFEDAEYRFYAQLLITELS